MRTAAMLTAFVVALWSGVSGQAPEGPSLRRLFEQHRWFDLRDAIAGRAAAPLYAGAVAVAFNQTRDAETYLSRAIHDAATKDEANEAREALASLYMRISRSRDMVRILDDMLAAAPDRADVRNMRDGFVGFRRIPNQTARLGRRTRFTCAVTPHGVSLPARVNGMPVDMLFDSGFSHTALSESDARMLGVSAIGANMSASDFSAAAQARVAVAERMTVAGSELQNVPVMIFPDSHPMWSDRPRGKQGIVALPVALALGGISWTRDGACRLGADSARRGSLAEANMAFDGESPPVTRIQLDDRQLDVSLDTGAQGGSQLWQRFGVEFPQSIARGVKRTIEVQQIGGRREEEIVEIPDLRFRLAGFDAVLPQARLFSNRTADGYRYGNMGMDVFAQAAEVTFDFRAMSIAFRQ